MNKSAFISLSFVACALLYTPGFALADWKTDCSFSSFDSNEKECFLSREYADSYFSFRLSEDKQGIIFTYVNESGKDLLTDSDKFLLRVDNNASIDLATSGEVYAGLESISSQMTPEIAHELIGQLLEGSTLRLRVGLIEPKHIQHIDFELSLTDFYQAWLKFQQETRIPWGQ